MVKVLLIIGICCYSDNDRYEGEWQKNLKDGKGKIWNKV